MICPYGARYSTSLPPRLSSDVPDVLLDFACPNHGDGHGVSDFGPSGACGCGPDGRGNRGASHGHGHHGRGVGVHGAGRHPEHGHDEVGDDCDH